MQVNKSCLHTTGKGIAPERNVLIRPSWEALRWYLHWRNGWLCERDNPCSQHTEMTGELFELLLCEILSGNWTLVLMLFSPTSGGSVQTHSSETQGWTDTVIWVSKCQSNRNDIWKGTSYSLSPSFSLWTPLETLWSGTKCYMRGLSILKVDFTASAFSELSGKF